MINFRFVFSLVLSLIWILLGYCTIEKDPIKYMQVPTIVLSTSDEASILMTLEDSLNNETIFLTTTLDKIPLYYYKKVRGEVCHNEECRLLDILVYWNITGRYLGFELPAGEFLSKHDHARFSEKEYQQLHTILANESLPLDRVAFEELIEYPRRETANVDGITAATSKTIADMVVKGAAYTTFKLWNTVNGSTMDVVSALTEEQLTPALLSLILQSQDIADRLWALHRIGLFTELTSTLEAILLEIIVSDDFYLSYSALNAINSNHLESVDFQNRLFSLYKNANHSTKSALLKKLMEAPFLSVEIIQISIDMLPQLNGQQLDILLDLYEKHDVKDLGTYKAVAKILNNENKYISKTAYSFLRDLSIDDYEIVRLLNAYEKAKL